MLIGEYRIVGGDDAIFSPAKFVENAAAVSSAVEVEKYRREFAMKTESRGRKIIDY